MPSPNVTTTGNFDERQEGDISVSEALHLDLVEADIVRIVGNRVSESEKFWNAELDLDNVRDRNEKYWLNNYLDESQLYDFQVPYKDNRIFTAIESLIPMALSRPPQPLVTEAYDTDASRELAHNLQDVLLAKYEDLYLKKKFMMVARHLLTGQRLAIMKYRWDTAVGPIGDDGERMGDIAVDVLRPKRVVVEDHANDPDDVPLVGEYCTASAEELARKFPKKAQDIWKTLEIKSGTTRQLTKKEGYTEVWFTYHDKQGKKKEAVAWKLKSTLLGAMPNPNWNYEETSAGDDGKLQFNNFLTRPQKPYIFFNYLNLGKYLIDDTSLTEQAKSLQEVLDKRGRQIVENADQANSGTIFNSDMISQENVAQLIGDPGEKAMVKGDVTRAATRLPSNLLPPYVMQDKQDARDEIDNIFATHDPMRGDSSGNRTLGQDVLSQRSDISRIQTLATAIEDGSDRLYKGMVQMMKVFYDQPKTVKNKGLSGKTAFIENFSQMSIEDGISVRVRSGSVMPDDPMAKQQKAIQLLPVIDPLTLGELLGEDDPKEFAKRQIMYKMFPDKYFTEILGDDPSASSTADPLAVQEQQQMLQGEMVPPQESPTKEHLATHQVFLQSPEFQSAPPEVQQIVVEHVKLEAEATKAALGQSASEEQPPMGEIPPDGMGGVESTPEQPTPTNNVPPRGIMGAVRSLFGAGQ